jgi:hypothetical protein
MSFFLVSVEAHEFSATIYIAGILANGAAARAAELLTSLPRHTRMLRVDLRSVHGIDSYEYVSLARALAPWRDGKRGRVTIEFPVRSDEATHLQLAV